MRSVRLLYGVVAVGILGYLVLLSRCGGRSPWSGKPEKAEQKLHLDGAGLNVGDFLSKPEKTEQKLHLEGTGLNVGDFLSKPEKTEQKLHLEGTGLNVGDFLSKPEKAEQKLHLDGAGLNVGDFLSKPEKTEQKLHLDGTGLNVGDFLSKPEKAEQKLHLDGAGLNVGDFLRPCGPLRKGKLLDGGEEMRRVMREAARNPLFPALTLERLMRVNLSHVGELCCDEVAASHPNTSIPEPFRPSMTEDERLIMLLSLHMYVRACQAVNHSFYLYAGTLLGAYRYNGLIPWDDDVDVIANFSQRVRLYDSLVAFGFLVQPLPLHWKICLKGMKKNETDKLLWPFIDVGFFKENTEKVFDIYGGIWALSKKASYPLEQHLFEGGRLPTPRDADVVLKREFDLDTCASPGTCHKNIGGRSKTGKVPCKTLTKFYPLV